MMLPAFYDPQKTYDKNFIDGPPLLSQNIKPRPRKQMNPTRFLGFDVNLPFGIAAGPLLNSQHLKTAFEFGFDVNHYKTQRSVSFPVNKFPNVLYVDIDGDLTIKKSLKPLIARKSSLKSPTSFSITNSFGNPSKGPEFWQEDMKKALSYAGPDQLLIASVVGTIQKNFTEEQYFDDFALTARLANDTGVKVIEVNLSCPNVANEGILCFNPEADGVICRKVKDAIGNTPLLVKFGYFTADQQDLLEKIVLKISPFVAGISAINTIPAPVVDIHGNQALPGPNRLMSGICGAGIKWAGLDMVRRLTLIREKNHLDYAIIGVGGVMDSDDFLTYRNMGADCVQSCTGAIWNPYLPHQIEKALIKTKNYIIS
jgi:dihydroorotate dehydrogenase (NAD+) catalytic subunit